MILKTKQSTVAYICSVCGATVISAVGIFALSGDMLKLKCPCGKSELVIKYERNGKIRLSVPCFVCHEAHSYSVSEGILFKRDIFPLTCKYSGLDIGFTGETRKVKKAIEEASHELLMVFLEHGLGLDPDDELGTGEKELHPDYEHIASIIMTVKELAADGKISCSCRTPHKAKAADDEPFNDLLVFAGEYENNCNCSLQLAEDKESFVLRCRECGGRYVIPSGYGLDDFFTVDFIELK